MAPGVRGSDSRVGPKSTYSRNVLDPRKSTSLLPNMYLVKTKCLVMMSMKASTKNVKFIATGPEFRLYGLVNMTISKNALDLRKKKIYSHIYLSIKSLT